MQQAISRATYLALPGLAPSPVSSSCGRLSLQPYCMSMKLQLHGTCQMRFMHSTHAVNKEMPGLLQTCQLLLRHKACNITQWL